ncbi:MAG: triose-phosphate isomerase [Candidatus Liptonbacteria bacterium]|nr:triose-phosphate isomerase [Candidatus Liptonbacteria bacterium]
MKKLLIANFKMHAPSAKAWASFQAPKGAEVVVCPAFPYLISFSGRRGFKLGAQNVFWENLRSGGAYTGEVSASMLRELGAEYVIIGHSERRQLGETDEMVNKKIKTALSAGLKVIFCVGESKETRRKGMRTAENFVRHELSAGLSGVKKNFLDKISVAYEPIWAIGTGVADTPKGADEMAIFIKKLLAVKVLYGGSVNSKNASAFLARKEIDGALVGGASLDPKEFKKIVEASIHPHT